MRQREGNWQGLVEESEENQEQGSLGIWMSQQSDKLPFLQLQNWSNMMSKAIKLPKLQTKFVAKKKVPKGRQMEVEPTEQKKHSATYSKPSGING